MGGPRILSRYSIVYGWLMLGGWHCAGGGSLKALNTSRLVACSWQSSAKVPFPCSAFPFPSLAGAMGCTAIRPRSNLMTAKYTPWLRYSLSLLESAMLLLGMCRSVDR